MNATRSANVAAEILYNTSSVKCGRYFSTDRGGQWRSTSRIARLVSLFEVIPVEHKRLQRFHVHYVRILIRLPCWRVTRYCVILEKGCTTAGIGGCTLLSLMHSWYKLSQCTTWWHKDLSYYAIYQILKLTEWLFTVLPSVFWRAHTDAAAAHACTTVQTRAVWIGEEGALWQIGFPTGKLLL